MDVAIGNDVDEEAGSQFKEGDDELWGDTKSLDFFPKKSEKTVVERIVSAFLEAAGIIYNHGRLPFFNYLVASAKCLHQPRSLLAVLDVFPYAVDRCDETTGLLPIESILNNVEEPTSSLEG
jgi:hypothetical protein